MNKSPKLTYEEAMEELNTILKELETGEPKVEEMGNMAKRASELLKYCREKLRGIEEEVENNLSENE